MKFIEDTTFNDIAGLIMQRQNKATINGIEILLPKQGYNMTYNERMKHAQQEARKIVKLLN